MNERAIVEIENNKVVRRWSSINKCAKDLYLTRQTIMNYCNNKTRNKAFNLEWEKKGNNEKEN